MPIAFIGVGSNLGDRKKNLQKAQETLARISGIHTLCSSGIYETEPVGGPSQGNYYNAVFRIETELSPRQLLDELLSVEKELGRKRSGVKDEPRVLDLDLLFYDDWIIQEPGLVVPHPRLTNRVFVLRPLMDLEPEWEHPLLGQTIRQIYETLIRSRENQRMQCARLTNQKSSNPF